MKTQVVGLVVLAACLVGCVPSLHELYTSDTLVYDPDLEGTWTTDNSTWTFIGDPNNKSYTLLIIEQDEKRGRLENKMQARLVEVGQYDYLDIFPDKDTRLNVGNWFSTSILRAHLFIRVQMKEDSIVLAVMNPDVVERMLEKNPSLVKHEVTEDRVVLTASPKELQAFLKQNASAKDFFGDPQELKFED